MAGPVGSSGGFLFSPPCVLVQCSPSVRVTHDRVMCLDLKVLVAAQINNEHRQFAMQQVQS